MLKQRLSAVHAVANEFLPAEAAVEDATLKALQCAVTMLQQHKAANLPPHVGAASLADAAEGAAHLARARQCFIASHQGLNVALKEIGLERMYGKDDEAPNNEPIIGPMWTGALLTPNVELPQSAELLGTQ